MKKTVLVAGSSGLIGTRFFEKYGNHFDLIAADLSDGVDILAFEATLKNISERIKGRVLDCVVHLAAFTDVSAAFEQSGDESSLCYQLNVRGTENMVKLANYFESHLIHFSTDFVFDGKTAHPITEEAIPNPIEWYGTTKLLAENSVVTHAKSWTIARIAFPYNRIEGARPDLVTKMANKIKAGETLYLFNDQLITPTFSDDIVDAIARFIDLTPLNEIFHVVGPESISPYDLGIRLVKLLNGPASNIIETSLLEYLNKDPRPRQQFLLMDSTKYQDFCLKHGFVSPLTLEEALMKNN